MTQRREQAHNPVVRSRILLVVVLTLASALLLIGGIGVRTALVPHDGVLGSASSQCACDAGGSGTHNAPSRNAVAARVPASAETLSSVFVAFAVPGPSVRPPARSPISSASGRLDSRRPHDPAYLHPFALLI